MRLRIIADQSVHFVKVSLLDRFPQFRAGAPDDQIENRGRFGRLLNRAQSGLKRFRRNVVSGMHRVDRMDDRFSRMHARAASNKKRPSDTPKSHQQTSIRRLPADQ